MAAQATSNPGSPVPVLIDTDPGLDDALALILALRSPALDVLAVTVVAGNNSLDACTANALRILEATDADEAPALFKGHAEPLSGRAVRAGDVHGSDGLGGISTDYPVHRLRPEQSHATEAIIEMARLHGEDLAIVALGPLTNIASAFAKDPDAMRGIGQLVVMGGTSDRRGNVTPTAEFNFYCDPTAAQQVVRAGLPTTLVGLNVTREALLPRDRFNQRVAAMRPGPLRTFLGDVSRPYFDFGRGECGQDACVMHDPLAVCALVDPAVIGTERFSCDVVDTPGLTRGMLRVERDAPFPGSAEAEIAISVDVPLFLDVFHDTVCAV